MQLYLAVISDRNCQGKTVDFVLQLPEDMDVRRPYSQCPVDRPQTPSAEHHCICQRPKTALACHKCDFRYVGRVRRTCPAHPRVSANNLPSNSYHLPHYLHKYKFLGRPTSHSNYNLQSFQHCLLKYRFNLFF